MQNRLISISGVAGKLGVSIDTLRRWDGRGYFKSIRKGNRSHRFYRQEDIEHFMHDIEIEVRQWAQAPQGITPEPHIYCATRDVFQARLEQFQLHLSRISSLPTVSLVTAIVGEIGNNSFDHNLGNWPDIPGVFFTYSFRDKKVVLADRGIGILATLKRVRPELSSVKEALKVAFTQIISGRFPEARGNGLKFVRSVITTYPLTLYFQTGNAHLHLKQNSTYIIIRTSRSSIRGCFATIGFGGVL